MKQYYKKHAIRRTEGRRGLLPGQDILRLEISLGWIVMAQQGAGHGNKAKSLQKSSEKSTPRLFLFLTNTINIRKLISREIICVH